MTSMLTRAAFVAGYAPAGQPWTGDALRRLYATEAAETEPQDAKRAGAIAALLAAIHRRRIKTHDDATAALAAVLAALAAYVNVDSLRDAVDDVADRDTRRAQAAAELMRQAIAAGVLATWRDTARDAHTNAVLSGTAAAAHYLSQGQIPVEPDTSPLPDLFDPQPWVEQQIGGLAGDIASKLAALDDAEAEAMLAGGRGADYYLDQQVGVAFNDATLAIYRDVGVDLVDWQTMSDERVCERCIGYAAGNPYRLSDVPESHGRCRCWITPTD